MFDEPKKTLILRILQVLESYSDINRQLTQSEIINYLKINYDIECERKAVARNIEVLEKIGYDIVRSKSGVYLDKAPIFENSEVRLLIDVVSASTHINEKQSAHLIKKLVSCADKSFKRSGTNAFNMQSFRKTKSQLYFLNIELLDEAIESGKKVGFVYNAYDEHCKLKPKKEERYVVNPYKLLIFNEHYYVIGNYDKYDNLTVYRIDKITDFKILEENIKPVSSIKGYENGLDVGKFKTTLPYFFIEESQVIEVICDSFMTDHLVDRFQGNVSFERVDGGKLKARIFASPKAFSYLAMQYGEFMEVLSPLSLREDIANKVIKMKEMYLV
ncbi:MAG: WYL domain-containing protein [Bacillota bacterium]